MERLSDSDLLALIKISDQAAFNELFIRHWERLYQIAQARLQDEDQAQDIVQEIFIRLWERRSKLQIHTAIENYLSGAVRLAVISHYRSQKVAEQQLQDALERINVLEQSIDSIDEYIELEKVLDEAVENMPEMLKKVYQLRSENMPVKAIAGQLGLADQTVKNYISEVSRRLRIIIIEKYPEKNISYIAILIAMLHK